MIKVLAGAGVLSEEESVGAPQYSQAELDAIVDEAAMWGEGRRARARRRSDQTRGDPPASGRSSTADWSTRKASIYDGSAAPSSCRTSTPTSTSSSTAPSWGCRRRSSRKSMAARPTGRELDARDQGRREVRVRDRRGRLSARGEREAVCAAGEALGYVAERRDPDGDRQRGRPAGWSDQVGRVAPGFYADLIAVAAIRWPMSRSSSAYSWVMKGGVVYKNDRARPGSY